MRLCGNCLSPNLTFMIAASHRAWFRCEECGKACAYNPDGTSEAVRVWNRGGDEGLVAWAQAHGVTLRRPRVSNTMDNLSEVCK